MVARSILHRWLAATTAVLLAGCATAGPGAATPTAATPSAAPSPTASPLDVPVTPIKASAIDVPGAADMSLSGNTLFVISGSNVASIDVTTGAVKTIDVGGNDGFDGIEVTKSSIWLADFGGSAVVRLDRAPGSKPVRIPMADAEDVLAVGDTIWVTNHHEGTITRIDANSNQTIGAMDVGQAGNSGPGRLAFGAGSVWMNEGNNATVVRLDPATGQVVATITLTHLGPCGGILVTDTAVWTTACHDGTVLGRIDPATNTEVTDPLVDRRDRRTCERTEAR